MTIMVPNSCIEISMFPYFFRLSENYHSGLDPESYSVISRCFYEILKQVQNDKITFFSISGQPEVQNTIKTVMDDSFRDFEKVSQGWPNLLNFENLHF